MSYQNLIIYKFKTSYEILKELDEFTIFKIHEAPDEKTLNEKIKSLDNNIILTSKKLKKKPRQVILDKLPIRFFKLFEKINIEFLKLQYSQKAELNIGKYKINLNSRELINQDKIIKLTEKETKIILYLSKANKPVSTTQLQSEVWGYSSELETHTVETHVYRLREKVFKFFENRNFISSQKNGYKINL